MGLRVPRPMINAKTDFECTRLMVVTEPEPGKKCRLKYLPKNFFGTRGSGFLGISHDGRYLVAVKAKLKETTVMYFLLSPGKAFLDHTMRLDTVGLMWRVKPFFPPVGNRYIAAYVVDQASLAVVDPTKSSNLPVSVYFVAPNYDFQIHVSTIVLVVPRHSPKTKERLEKHNVRCHSHGLILNTGVNLVSLMLVDEPLEEATDRQTWYICANPVKSWLLTKEFTITSLDLGEAIAVTKTQRDLIQPEVPLQYVLIDVKRGKPEFEGAHGGVLPQFFSRQTLNLENVCWRAVEQLLRRVEQFKGCRLVGLRDYEADVGEIERGIAPVTMLALCELEMYVDNGTSTNEFHLFNLNIDWDLFEGSYKNVSFQYLKKVPHGAAFSNQWWPLERYPVAYSVQNAALDNRFVFLGKHFRTLRTPDGSWELFYKQQDGLAVQRGQPNAPLQQALHSTDATSASSSSSSFSSRSSSASSSVSSDEPGS